MSFRSIFSVFKKKPPKPPISVEYNGMHITAVEKVDNGQFHTSGVITRTIDGIEQQAFFIRADKHSSKEQAEEHSLQKGKQIIDEQGEDLFKREHI